jgi:hypothetical protein
VALFSNFTRFSVGETAGFDRHGREFYTVVAKATFVWDRRGAVELSAEMRPIAEADIFAGEPGQSSVLAESDLVPHKPRMDVLLCGSMELPTEVEQVDVTLEVGERLRKVVRVFGDRYWLPGGLQAVSLTRPRPFRAMPFLWERAFGGFDPDDPRVFESRNPVGVGLRRHARSLEGQRAPNFEDPSGANWSWNGHGAPVGFGPVGRHWQPRVRLAGTYNQTWLEEYFPLLPPDFDERYFNCAPEDQQLKGYLPGEEVRLHYMTTTGHDRFQLPRWAVPVRIGEYPGKVVEYGITPDTLAIEPAARCFSLIGRVAHYPEPDVLALRQVLVGTPSKGQRRAAQTEKRYLDFRGRREDQA